MVTPVHGADLQIILLKIPRENGIEHIPEGICVPVIHAKLRGEVNVLLEARGNSNDPKQDVNDELQSFPQTDGFKNGINFAEVQTIAAF
jgi:hypothetical protein